MISYPFQAHLANTKRRAFNNIEQGLYLGACNACFKFTLQVCPYETDVMAEVCMSNYFQSEIMDIGLWSFVLIVLTLDQAV